MKNDGSLFFDSLRTETGNIALVWTVERTDGEVLGFTSWDEPFTFLGIDIQPTNAFQGTASAQKNTFAVDNMTAQGLLTAVVDDQDLKGGKYANARVRVYWVDPTAPENGFMPLRGGRIGEIKVKQTTFEAEIRSPAQKLQQPFGRVYTLECDADYGDSQCKVNLNPATWTPNTAYIAKVSGDAGIGSVVKPSVYNGFWYYCHQAGTSGGVEPAWPTVLGGTVSSGSAAFTAFRARRQPGTVTGVFNRAVFSDKNNTAPVNFFKYGLLTWLSGNNEGITVEVRGFEGAPWRTIILMEAMPYLIQVGDAYEMVQGCSKTRPRCKEDDNIFNMRAFPFMPTEDKALETPNFTSQGEDTGEDDGGFS